MKRFCYPKNRRVGTTRTKACGAGSVGGMPSNGQSTRHPAVKQEAFQFIGEQFTKVQLFNSQNLNKNEEV